MIYDNEMPMMIFMFESCSTFNSCIAANWVSCLCVCLIMVTTVHRNSVF